MNTSVKAYAKINLALNVYDRKEDGYHNIDMVTIPLDLHDIIELELLPKGYESYITSDDDSLPTDESNLSNKAFRKMKEKFHIDKNVLIHIYKRIPMCAGLGGGSADAAAVINATLKAIKLKPSQDDLISLASSIGADVSFCLYNKPARCRGIGEKLDFITLKKRYHVLLIKPNEGVSTALAYQTFDELETKPQLSNIERLIEGLKIGDEKIIAGEMKNSLQECAIKIVPEIKNIIDTLRKDGFPLTMMSGSGSTVFCMSLNHHAILEEYKKFSKLNYTVIATQTL
ncbi:MAG: 4-(cytidine 5'-diphospho)-2-C-methyl-D-erythritol kinase [Bacilli bacterium]